MDSTWVLGFSQSITLLLSVQVLFTFRGIIMKTTKLILLFLSASFLLMTTGCATFKSDMQGKLESSAEKNYQAEKVSLLLIFSHFGQTKGWDAIPKLDNQRQRIWGFDDFLVDALNEFSNIQKYSTFTEYASDVNEPHRRAQKDSLMQKHDYVLKMKFMREKSFAKKFLGTLFSSLSFTLIPVPYTCSYSVNADLYNSKGQLLKNYSRQASLTKWVQTVLLFAYPFHPEQRKKEELYVEFLHDIFKQVESEKVLSKK